MPNRASRCQGGFTLIEMLVAIAVFAVMAAMAYGGLSAVLNTRASVTAALERDRTLQMAVWHIQHDIAQIVARPTRDEFGDRIAPVFSTPESGLSISHNGWRNPLNQARSSLQRTRYRLDEHDNWVRAYWQRLDRAPEPAAVTATLIADADAVEWHFLNAADEWLDRWPPHAQGFPTTPTAEPADGAGIQLPRAIELRLKTATWGELRLVFMVPGAQE